MNKKFKLIAKRLNSYCNLFGFYPFKTIANIKRLPDYFQEKTSFKKLRSTYSFVSGQNIPCLDEKNNESGEAGGHYFHADLFVAQKIFAANPQKHIDIGSRIDGFVAHVGSFREIEVFDIRPQSSSIRNIVFRQIDLMATPSRFISYCDSISSLHAIEHFGLGRYGDPLDPDGYLKGLENIYTILKPGGVFYLAVPFGPQRIEFNAQRVFSLTHLLYLFEEKYKIISFSYVGDNGRLFENSELTNTSVQNNFNCIFGCSIFELRKL
jgi:SAM-dependent methyltransferase